MYLPTCILISKQLAKFLHSLLQIDDETVLVIAWSVYLEAVHICLFHVLIPTLMFYRCVCHYMMYHYYDPYSLYVFGFVVCIFLLETSSFSMSVCMYCSSFQTIASLCYWCLHRRELCNDELIVMTKRGPILNTLKVTIMMISLLSGSFWFLVSCHWNILFDPRHTCDLSVCLEGSR